MTTLGERAERTRSHILEQGLALIMEKGLKNTTIREICEAAEVSVGTFYTYFRSKNELFYDRFGQHGPNFAHFVREQIKNEALLDKFYDFFRYYSWLNISTGVEKLRVVLSPGGSFFEKTNPTTETLRGIIEEGRSAGLLSNAMSGEDMTNMFIVLLRGCGYEWMMENGSYDLEEQITRYAMILLSAVLNGSRDPEPRRPGDTAL